MPPVISPQQLPETVRLNKNTTMTFPRNQSFLSRVHVAATSKDDEPFFIPPHWHENHEDIFSIVKGRLEVLIGTETRIFLPSDGEIRIPRGVVHSLRAFQGEECIFEERTDPMDNEKEIFIRNSVEDEPSRPDIFKIMLLCYHGDLCPTLFQTRMPWLEKVFVTILGGYIAPLLGYKLKYPNIDKS